MPRVKSFRFLIVGCSLLLSLTAGTASGQAVQLPTFQMFSVRTTVVAPDAGGASNAGMRRGYTYRNSQRSPLGSPAPLNVGRQAGGIGVRANIIRPDELETVLLEQAATDKAPAAGATIAKGPLFAAPPASVRAIRAGALAGKSDNTKALEHLERGRAAAADGEASVARIYYRLAAQAGDAEMQAIAQRELSQLADGASRRVAQKP